MPTVSGPIEQLQLIRERTEQLVDGTVSVPQREVLPQLAQHGIRLIVPDEIRGNRPIGRLLPSHGLSDHHADGHRPELIRGLATTTERIYLMARLRRRSGLGPQATVCRRTNSAEFYPV